MGIVLGFFSLRGPFLLFRGKDRRKRKKRARLDFLLSLFTKLDAGRRRFFSLLFSPLNRSLFLPLFLSFRPMAGSRLPPLRRGGGGSGAALAAREQDSLSQPFSQAMLARGDDAMGLGFDASCTGFDASGAPVVVAGGGERAAAASTHVVQDWDATNGAASRKRGKVSFFFFVFFLFLRLLDLALSFLTLFSLPTPNQKHQPSLGLQRPHPRPLLPLPARGRRRRYAGVPAPPGPQAAGDLLLCVSWCLPQPV